MIVNINTKLDRNKLERAIDSFWNCKENNTVGNHYLIMNVETYTDFCRLFETNVLNSANLVTMYQNLCVATTEGLKYGEIDIK